MMRSRAPLLRSIRSQTGMLFFAGLFLLVAIVFSISLIVSHTIRLDDAALAQIRAARLTTGDATQGALTQGALTQGALDAEIARLATHRDSNAGMVRGLYAALFLASLVFLFIGLWFIQQMIVSPLESLHLLARRVASGDLDTPAELGGATEFQELAGSFEAMRVELRAARARQMRWSTDLEARVSQRTQQLAALSQVVSAASRSLELDVLMTTALEQSLLVMDMEAGGLWLLDAEDVLRLSAEVGMSGSARARLASVALTQGATGRAAASGQTIVIEDVLAGAQIASAVIVEEGFRGMIAVPIRVRERVLGVLDVLTSRPRTFTPDEIALLTSVGQQIGLALDTVRLMQEVRTAAERLAGLQERERIALELHDGLLQTLGYLYLKTDQMEEFAAARGLVELTRQLAAQRDVLENASHEVRRYISELGELPLRLPASLPAALAAMIAEFRAVAPGGRALEIELRGDDPALLLPNDVVVHLVAITREALTNAALHGHAQRALVQCGHEAGENQLRISDDGCGFNPGDAPSGERPHFGLNVMHARAARIGGTLAIAAAPGCGVQVTVSWPQTAADKGRS